MFLLPGIAATQTPDSISRQGDQAIRKHIFYPKRVTGRSYILPAALISYGTVATIVKVNKKEAFTVSPGSAGKETSPFLVPENYTALAPAAAVLGLQAFGVKGAHKPGEQALLYALSAGLSSAIVYPLKNNTRVLRPDKSNDHSFPSGHSSLAFASAEFLRREYGQRSVWYTVAGYTAATATAVLRVAKDKHWLADVSTGAGIGIASTTTVYWIYDKIINKRRSENSATLLFAPAVSNGYYGVYVVKRL
ncbi:phosphatase PAP2 family protein [Niabella sp. 3A5MI-3]|nr:phosphatase PAP2 family protein [Niabella beijingensis]